MPKKEVISKEEKLIRGNLNNLYEIMKGSMSLEDFIVHSIESMIQIERDEYLKEFEVGKNKCNGYYRRFFSSLLKNSMSIRIARTRSGGFKPAAMELLKYSAEQVNELILELYSKGLTMRDTSDILEKFFGEEVSASKVSSLASSFSEVRKIWENSKLEKYYKVMYCDAIWITVRRGNSYAKEPVFIAFGVREDNKRELLLLENNPSESSELWGEYFAKLRMRGVDKIDLVVADGIVGLEKAVMRNFPGADLQKCVVHKYRNILNKVRPRDKAALAEDLKHVFDNFDKDSKVSKAKEKLECFANKWGNDYPQILRSISRDEIDYYFTYIKYPCKVRRMIYTTNTIESLNKQLRKATKNKQSFENTDRLLDYLCVVIQKFEQENWMRYPISEFNAWIT